MPTGLLPKATKNYKPPTTDTTAAAITPYQWAHQCLALNMSTFLAKQQQLNDL
jgi:hypothetical protein